MISNMCVTLYVRQRKYIKYFERQIRINSLKIDIKKRNIYIYI
jgi:hypothetical protein